MKSLYAQTSDVLQATLPVNVDSIQVERSAAPDEGKVQAEKQFKESINSKPESSASNVEKPPQQNVSPKQKGNAKEQTLTGELSEVENSFVKLSEAEFLRLLKTEKMDFYSLAEVLRGSSMALYCVLYSESLAKGENRCQMRQTELMMRAGINNPATLYKQERWLTALRLISKTVRLGNHHGASYDIRPLEILPLPRHILDQFGGYLLEIIG